MSCIPQESCGIQDNSCGIQDNSCGIQDNFLWYTRHFFLWYTLWYTSEKRPRSSCGIQDTYSCGIPVRKSSETGIIIVLFRSQSAMKKDNCSCIRVVRELDALSLLLSTQYASPAVGLSNAKQLFIIIPNCLLTLFFCSK